MNAWKRVRDGKQAYGLILEDDSSPTQAYLSGLYQIIDAVPDLDMVNLCVLRPQGRDMNVAGLLKVEPNQTLDYARLPNVWTCAYLLSRKGADKLLELFRKRMFQRDNHFVASG